MPLKTSGFTNLSDDLARISEGLSKASIEKALTNGAQPVYEKIKEKVSVVSGVLEAAQGIGKIHRWRGGQYYIRVGTINGAEAPYAHAVEDGHGGPHPAPAHPFTRPAFDETKDEAFSIVRETISEEMKG